MRNRALRLLALALFSALALFLFFPGPAGATDPPTEGAVAGVPDLSTYKYDPGPDPASWARTISFGTATDTTYILGFEGCVATVSGGTQDVGIQFLGDPEKNLDNGGLWLMGRANDSPRNGKDRTSWALMTLLAGKPFYFGYGGLQAIRVKGAGLAGTVNIFVSKKGPGC